MNKEIEELKEAIKHLEVENEMLKKRLDLTTEKINSLTEAINDISKYIRIMTVKKR